jgi:Na+-driven multidrug efflux pump
VAILITGPAWSLQQLTTALVTGQEAYRRVRNFTLTLSAIFGLLLALVTYTPLYGLVMGGVYNLSPALQQLAHPAMQIMVFLPLVMGAQALLRGVLIRGGCTGDVRTAMAVNVGTLGATLLVGITFWSPTGAVLAAAATLTGGLAELAWLRWRSRC